MKNFNFKHGREMFETIAKDVDLYNPITETYVFRYNERDSIAVYGGINEEKAKELLALSKENGEYWGAFLGVGGYIYDAETEDGEYSLDAMNWCNTSYPGLWIATSEYEEFANCHELYGNLASVMMMCTKTIQDKDEEEKMFFELIEELSTLSFTGPTIETILSLCESTLEDELSGFACDVCKYGEAKMRTNMCGEDCRFAGLEYLVKRRNQNED